MTDFQRVWMKREMSLVLILGLWSVTLISGRPRVDTFLRRLEVCSNNTTELKELPRRNTLFGLNSGILKL